MGEPRAAEGAGGQGVSWIVGAVILAGALGLIWLGDSDVPAPVGRGALAPGFRLDRLDGEGAIGLSDFRGECFHTGRWPHQEVDFRGMRVAVIGTGSSAIQSIPVIAEQAAHLTVFQRTANYSVPAHNGPLDPERVREFKADIAGFRERNSQLPFGAGFKLNLATALESTSEQQQREYDEDFANDPHSKCS